MGRFPSRRPHPIIKICCLPPLQRSAFPGDASCPQMPVLSPLWASEFEHSDHLGSHVYPRFEPIRVRTLIQVCMHSHRRFEPPRSSNVSITWGARPHPFRTGGSLVNRGPPLRFPHMFPGVRRLARLVGPVGKDRESRIDTSPSLDLSGSGSLTLSSPAESRPGVRSPSAEFGSLQFPRIRDAPPGSSVRPLA